MVVSSTRWSVAPAVRAASRSWERIMKSGRRGGMAALLVAGARNGVGPAAAQQVDIAAAQKRFQDLYAAGNYAAAFAEAQKTEAAAKRGGTNNIAYVLALNDLARAPPGVGPLQRRGRRCSSRCSAPCRTNVPPTDRPGGPDPGQPGHGLFAARQPRRGRETVQAGARHLRRKASGPSSTRRRPAHQQSR